MCLCSPALFRPISHRQQRVRPKGARAFPFSADQAVKPFQQGTTAGHEYAPVHNISRQFGGVISRVALIASKIAETAPKAP
jgi:hypothetical protein